MLKTLFIAGCLWTTSVARIFDPKIITEVRNGLEKNLDYIDRNYKRVNVDCLFGVALATALIDDAYQNGTHIMDKSSLEIMEKSLVILKKSIPYSREKSEWITDAFLYPTIWRKNICYRSNALHIPNLPSFKYVKKIFNRDYIDGSEIDFCLQNIVNFTNSMVPTRCFIDRRCWKYFEPDENSVGYLLTHKLLILQLAKARKCYLNDNVYGTKTEELCSSILSEVVNADYYGYLDNMFDLYLEQVVLCGYEGYTEFLQNKWLYYILKSQRSSGCFPAFLDDSLKTRMKRNSNTLDDGCVDHTTGLGAAVLALHYNYIIKEYPATR
ncbi:unnamed protein product [Acanthoscelides obtectus]|uniref:Uncharacterized protein n=1 Tax=Acanthoscelides obtectus TaxID=200917 RepID=A0A9P0KPE7_ACAOB|nr:unnamed protein product [Acanthoscelides obtectus]CAK1647318.1 hypothetical protein AOBTE_LOCUS15177 [Acanthoscelides obtectus]